MALLDLLGRRWALRVLWELRHGSGHTFRALQESCGGVSSSVLNQRLGELRDAGIVASEGSVGYRLSGEGRELVNALGPIDAWSKRWAKRAPQLESPEPQSPRKSRKPSRRVRVRKPSR
jgi:DNA-binding HxlR family transcriptional regulator